MQHMIQIVEAIRHSHPAGQEALPVRTGLPCFEQHGIDYARAQPVTLDDAVLEENRILTGHEPGLFAESSHLLRTQILQHFRENGWNSLAVTSPRPGAGKTLTSINLAISMARLVDMPVLLVDADLNHPAILKQLGLPERRGLGDYLADDVPVEKLLIRSSHFEDLVILPGGQPQVNAAEMLNSEKMKQLVKGMISRTQRRFIIFDLPPLLGTSEAVAFSPQVDAALLVIEDGITTKQDVEHALEMLDTTELVGTVLNKAHGAPEKSGRRRNRGGLFF